MTDAPTAESVDFDVIIVGAGPTGLTTANLLGRFGIRTLLIERNSQTVQEPRAVSIDDEALRTMQACGLVEEVKRNVALDYGSIYLGPSGKPFTRVRPTIREYGHPRRNAFRQPVLEATLADGLKRFPCVELRFNHTLVEFDQTLDRVNVLVRDVEGREARFSARYLAGCDGGRSIIRKAIGATLHGSSFEERWLIVDLKETFDPFRETRVFCDPARPAISLPGPHRTRRYEIRLLDDDDPEGISEPECVRELLAERGADAEAPIARKQVYTFHARRADKWRERRVLLLGDAAHLTPPFAGQGMNTGLRDAQNFAWKVAAVTRGIFGDALLDTYEQERSPHAWSMIELALNMGAVMAPHKAWKARLTRAAFRMLALYPPARDYFTQMRFKPAPKFDKGFLLKSADADIVGRMFPQPLVETTSSGRVLLDEVTGLGFSLVYIGQDAAAVFQELHHHDVWRRLGASLIHILPRDFAFAKPGPATVVRDAEGFFDEPHRKLLAGRCFLLRPDRYVAAAMAPEEIKIVSVAFAELCQQFGLDLSEQTSASKATRQPVYASASGLYNSLENL